MKKTFYYNFLPSKVEEEVSKANKNTEVAKVLIEIRDVYLRPQVDLENPWKMKKILTNDEIVTGKLKLQAKECFDHVFRYWALDMVNDIMMGHTQSIMIWDVSEEQNPIRYCNEYCFYQKGTSTTGGAAFLMIGFKELFRDRCLNPGDEIGLFWHFPTTSFQFKILLRHRELR